MTMRRTYEFIMISQVNMQQVGDARRTEPDSFTQEPASFFASVPCFASMSTAAPQSQICLLRVHGSLAHGLSASMLARLRLLLRWWSSNRVSSHGDANDSRGREDRVARLWRKVPVHELRRLVPNLHKTNCYHTKAHYRQSNTSIQSTES